MTFEEAIELLDNVKEAETRDFTDQFGRIDVDSLEIENYRLWAKEVHKVISALQETYAPKIKMTKRESDMLKRMKRTPQISVGIVDYSGREPKVLLSNESYFVDAWLHPELIEVSDDR